MSRTNKSRASRWRGRGGHGYLTRGRTWLKFAKEQGNRRIRATVGQQLKDILFTDAFDEKELLGRKPTQLWDRWQYS